MVMKMFMMAHTNSSMNTLIYIHPVTGTVSLDCRGETADITQPRRRRRARRTRGCTWDRGEEVTRRV
jgi:hypothetical protein